MHLQNATMNQNGYTLLELLVALGIGAVILTASLQSVQQVVVGADRGVSQVVAMTDVTQAAHRIRTDLVMAQSTSLTDGDPDPQSSLTLSWIDQTRFGSSDPTPHTASYALSGTTLQRTYDGVVGIVGRNITSIGFTQDGRVITFVITSTGPGMQQRTKTLTFSGHMRPEVTQ
jgi:prepilin-type N-terminal cleavage/methylation domain-containing protein